MWRLIGVVLFTILIWGLATAIIFLMLMMVEWMWTTWWRPALDRWHLKREIKKRQKNPEVYDTHTRRWR